MKVDVGIQIHKERMVVLVGSKKSIDRRARASDLVLEPEPLLRLDSYDRLDWSSRDQHHFPEQVLVAVQRKSPVRCLLDDALGSQLKGHPLILPFDVSLGSWGRRTVSLIDGVSDVGSSEDLSSG